jgi:hypothetical protein
LDRSVATFDFFFSAASFLKVNSVGKVGSVVDLFFVTLGLVKILVFEVGDGIPSGRSWRGLGMETASSAS